MKAIDFAEAEKVRLAEEQSKRIAKMYKDLSEEVAAKAQALPSGKNISTTLKKKYLENLTKEIGSKVDAVTGQLKSEMTLNMHAAAGLAVDANNKFMSAAGLNIAGSLYHVPTEVVNSLMTGSVYKGNFNFSRALWQQGEKVKRDMYEVVARGITEQKGTFDIAKDLEKYLDPSARKDWAWSKVYPGTNKKVDYSAQRLARTLTQHSYQLSLKKTVKHNPFVETIRWNSGHSTRTCPICADRDGTLYPKDKLPLDHPNGLCYFTVDVPDLESVADRIADWNDGKPDPELDKYALYAHNGKLVPKAETKMNLYNWNIGKKAWESTQHTKSEIMSMDKGKKVQFIQKNVAGAKGLTKLSDDALNNMIDDVFKNGPTTKPEVKPMFNKKKAQNLIDQSDYSASIEYAKLFGYKPNLKDGYLLNGLKAQDFLNDLLAKKASKPKVKTKTVMEFKYAEPLRNNAKKALNSGEDIEMYWVAKQFGFKGDIPDAKAFLINALDEKVAVKKPIAPAPEPIKPGKATLQDVDNMLREQDKLEFRPFKGIRQDMISRYADDWEEFAASIPEEYMWGLTRYTGGSYRDMNQYLRGITSYVHENDKISIDRAKKALDQARLKQDTALRRGSDQLSLLGMVGKLDEAKASGDMQVWLRHNKDSLIGTVAEDKGFMSTTPKLGAGFSSNGVEYRIFAPKGTKGEYIAPISNYPEEHEILLQAGTRFIIRDIVEESGEFRVFLEVIVEP